jgi:DNA repair exonuclease SbcCD ATPase subunit
MQPVALAIGAVAGVILGFIIASMSAKKAKAELEARIVQNKEELSRIRRETSEQMTALKASQAEAEKALETARGKVAALEQAVGQSREQANQFATSLQDVESARARLKEEAAAHQAARQQAEGKARQSQEQASAAQRNLEDLERRLRELQEKHDALATVADRRAKDIQQLKAGIPTESAAGLGQSVEAFADAAGSLPDILKILLETEEQKAVVLADANGIVVAAAGDTKLREGMAAASRLVTSLNAQLEGVLPFQSIRAFLLQDDHAVLTGRTFQCTGETVSLATYGTQEPGRRMIDGAMANVSAALE